MRFSLVMGTVDRSEPLEIFLRSLADQTYKNLELIVVDQNRDDRVLSLVEPYRSRMSIKHVRGPRGLSRARNQGLALAEGELIAFPDDDCWYPANLLQAVHDFFQANSQWDGLTGRCTDEFGRSSMGRFARQAGPVTTPNVWRRLTSFTIFLRSRVTAATGLFDESLGVGAGTPWGSGEEMDYMLRVLAGGFQVYYDSDLIVYHPVTVASHDLRARQRHYNYGQGMGRVLRKHRQPSWFVAYHWLRPLGGAAWALCRRDLARARYHYSCFVGRLRGWLARPDR